VPGHLLNSESEANKYERDVKVMMQTDRQMKVMILFMLILDLNRKIR